MAYVLGLVYSDGNIYKGTLSWELQMRDIELLFKVRDTMRSDYPIKLHEKRNSAKLRITNPEVIRDIKRLGFASNCMKFPPVPQELLKHFVRAFLEGDGWVIADWNKMEICVGFSNRNYEFLKTLVEKLNECISLTKNNLRVKKKRSSIAGN